MLTIQIDRYTDTENADACSKLWSVYVDEAERYDKRLVESWKGDMDGMLIFVRPALCLWEPYRCTAVWSLLRQFDSFPD